MTPFEYAQREHEHPSRNWHNGCGIFTRSAFGQPSIGDFDGDGAADAEDIWKAAKFKHYETDPMKIPRGVPVFWSGGSADNGHAAGPAEGDGTVWGTDLTRDGCVDRYRIADVHAKWGLTLLGWTEDLNGVRVWTPPAPPKPPKPEPLTDAEKEKAIRRRARDAEAAGHPGWAARLKAWADRIGKRAS